MRARLSRASAVLGMLLLLLMVGWAGRTPPPPAESADRVLDRLASQPDASLAAEVETQGPEVDAAREAMPEVIPVGQASELFVPIAKLEIPTIGLAVDVRNGVTDAILELGVGLWEGTAETGEYVISGHRTTYGRPFHDLDLLAPGDPVVLTVGSQAPETFEVIGTEIVPEVNYVDHVLAGTPEPQDRVVTMYACHPKGERKERIVVRARAIEG